MNLFCVKDGVGQVLKLKDVPHSLGYNITNPSTSGQLYFSTKVEAKVQIIRGHMGTKLSSWRTNVARRIK